MRVFTAFRGPFCPMGLSGWPTSATSAGHSCRHSPAAFEEAERRNVFSIQPCCCNVADPALRTEEQVQQIDVLKQALRQIEKHQAKLRDDMVVARIEVPPTLLKAKNFSTHSGIPQPMTTTQPIPSQPTTPVTPFPHPF